MREPYRRKASVEHGKLPRKVVCLLIPALWAQSTDSMAELTSTHWQHARQPPRFIARVPVEQDRHWRANCKDELSTYASGLEQFKGLDSTPACLGLDSLSMLFCYTKPAMQSQQYRNYSTPGRAVQVPALDSIAALSAHFCHLLRMSLLSLFVTIDEVAMRPEL